MPTQPSWAEQFRAAPENQAAYGRPLTDAEWQSRVNVWGANGQNVGEEAAGFDAYRNAYLESGDTQAAMRAQAAAREAARGSLPSQYADLAKRVTPNANAVAQLRTQIGDVQEGAPAARTAPASDPFRRFLSPSQRSPQAAPMATQNLANPFTQFSGTMPVLKAGPAGPTDVGGNQPMGEALPDTAVPGPGPLTEYGPLAGLPDGASPGGQTITHDASDFGAGGFGAGVTPGAGGSVPAAGGVGTGFRPVNRRRPQAGQQPAYGTSPFQQGFRPVRQNRGGGMAPANVPLAY